MAYKLSDIARAIDAELLGDGELEISSVASPEHASVHDIALAMDPKYAADLPKGKARCAMLWPVPIGRAWDCRRPWLHRARAMRCRHCRSG